jgi:hypothetical protein
VKRTTAISTAVLTSAPTSSTASSTTSSTTPSTTSKGPRSTRPRPTPEDKAKPELDPADLLRALAAFLAPLVAAHLHATDHEEHDHYVNGRSPRLPVGWSVDRFLRACREWRRTGAVPVKLDGKLRIVLASDVDRWLASTSSKSARLPPKTSSSATSRIAVVSPTSLDDAVAHELGLRPRRAAR